jgi:hypothetical protein
MPNHDKNKCTNFEEYFFKCSWTKCILYYKVILVFMPVATHGHDASLLTIQNWTSEKREPRQDANLQKWDHNKENCTNTSVRQLVLSELDA